jgi:ABC-type uncharacterized transport system permease subunit
MNTLRVLLWKDLRRAWRNPVGWVIFLVIPVAITALVGLAFGPKSNSGGLGRIRFALVDEDDSMLTRFLKGGLTQGESSQYLEPLVLDKGEALRQVREDKISALLIIPKGFTRNYLVTTNVVTLELIKNPAQSIHPAVLEELVEVFATALDAIKRNFGDELPQWQTVFDDSGDYHRVAELIVRAGDRIEAARKVLSPLRVTYTKDAPAESGATQNTERMASPSEASVQRSTKATTKAPGVPDFNIFGYLLPGLVSMFLLFLGDNAARDVQREVQERTLQRYRTLHHQLYVFVVSKGVFCFVLLLLSSVVMLGGGGLLFRIHWRDPLAVAALTASYCLFACGLMLLLPALLGEHRAAQAMGNVTAMMIGLAGGSTFPAEQLPAFLRNFITPVLPNYWYSQAVRAVAFNTEPPSWIGIAAKTALVGLVLMAVAALALRRGLAKGSR